jgi:hypothetical protein
MLRVRLVKLGDVFDGRMVPRVHVLEEFLRLSRFPYALS